MVNTNQQFVEKFVQNMRSVYDWNMVARQGNADFDAVDAQKQISFTLEEIKETIAAIATNDAKEVKDGLADTFVTASFLAVMYCGIDKAVELVESINFTNSFEESVQYHKEASENVPASIIPFLDIGTINSLALNLENYKELLSILVQYFYSIAIIKRDEIDVFADIERVMESNWTKFPLMEEVPNPEAEVAWIQENRSQQGVTFTSFNGRYIFHNSYGKIVKPSHFKEPQF